MDELRNNGESLIPSNQVGRIAKTVMRKADPKQYLLSHATIVASVDAYAPKGVKLGKQFERGVQIDVRYPEYRIKPDVQHLINNNNDSWDRPLLLSTYKTFVGAQHYCFVPGTTVLMADGTLKSIQDVNVGDEVISHTGTPRRVLHKFERQYSGEVKDVYIGHKQTPITCTPNHEFFVLDRDKCEKCSADFSPNKRPTSIKNRLNRKFCVDCGRNNRNAGNDGYVRAVKAENLKKDSIVYSPIHKSASVHDNERFSKILGYYLADGYRVKGRNTINFYLGKDERSMFQEIVDGARYLDPACLVSTKVSTDTEQSIILSITSKILPGMLVSAGGEKSVGKKLSQDYINSATPDDILNLIGGYVNGDGDLHQTAQRARAVSVSLDLLQQIQYLGLRAGLNSFIISHDTQVKDKTELAYKDGSIHIIEHSHPAWALHFDVDSTSKIHSVLDPAKQQSRKATAGSFRFDGDKRIDIITKIDTRHYEGNVYNLEVDVDHSYVVDGIVSTPQCEHIQIPELSKGFILDAIARDIGPSVYIDILVATDKKHDALVQDILSGKMNSLSMGCISQFTICTKCGNVASDDASLCPCITVDGKGSTFVDEDGQEHKIAELIGHVSVPNSNVFIEASWVNTPAFAGAVRRNVLNEDESALAQLIVNSQNKKTVIPSGGMRKRAADETKDEAPVVEAPVELESGEGVTPELPELPVEAKEVDAPSKAPTQAPDAESTAGIESEDADSSDVKLDRVVDKIQESLIDAVVKKIEDRFNPKPEEVGSVVIKPGIPGDMNDNLVMASELSRAVLCDDHFANDVKSIARRLATQVKAPESAQKLVNHRDMLILLWATDKRKGRKYPTSFYKTAMIVGPMAKYSSPMAYLAAVKLHLGRVLTDRDLSFFLEKGELTSIAGF